MMGLVAYGTVGAAFVGCESKEVIVIARVAISLMDAMMFDMEFKFFKVLHEKINILLYARAMDTTDATHSGDECIDLVKQEKCPCIPGEA